MSTNLFETHHHEHGPHPIRYFLPNQAILHLEHPPNLEPELLVDSLNKYIGGNAPWNDRLAPSQHERAVTFRSGASIAPVAFKVLNDDEDAAYDSTAEVIRGFYEAIPKGEEGITIDEANGIKLMSAAPNWLIGAASHQIGIGGPGNWPEEADPADTRWPEFSFIEAQLPGSVKNERGEGVHVAILDSSPRKKELEDAYKYWHINHPGEHPLLEELLAPGGPLQVHPATADDLLSLEDYSAAGHRYPMPDHGTFIAGIIHTIARGATLHLYEVLNPYGMGSIETIAKGLLSALSNSEIGRPLVINCSFMLGAVYGKKSGDGFDPQMRVFDANLLPNLTLTARDLFETIERNNVMVVAAAGNDAEPGSAKPPARYPAAYQKVIGVGALTKPDPSTGIKEFAGYSNQADLSPERGYLTLGGEKGDGIEGVYIGSLPVNLSGLPDKDLGIQPEDIGYVPNLDRGWAKWSGTSFAAPIISGLLAAWWSSNPGQTPTDARNFLDGIAKPPDSGATTSFTGTEKTIAVDRA